LTEISHLPKKFGFKEGAEDFPLMVVVSATYVCNARCPNCPYTNSEIRKNYSDAPFIKPEIFKKIADECGKYDSYIRITGGGEPLLHPQMIDLIGYAKKVGCKIGLITNGSLLTPDKADRLLAVDTDVIEISADAADERTYSKVRRGLDFNTLVNNVRYLVKKRNQMKSKTKVVVSVVNQEAVKDKLTDIVKYWEKIVDKVQVRKYLTWGFLKEKSGDPTPYLPVRVSCPFPFERLNIDTRGKIEFCGFDIAGETDFGNVMKTTIQSVWTGKRFSAWRRLILEGKYEEIPVCKKCTDWKYRSWKYNYWKVVRDAERSRKNKLGSSTLLP